MSGVILNETYSLQEMDRSPGLSEEDISTVAHGGSLKTYRTATVFQDAVNHHAVDKGRPVDHNRYAFKRFPHHNVHLTAPENSLQVV